MEYLSTFTTRDKQGYNPKILQHAGNNIGKLNCFVSSRPYKMPFFDEANPDYHLMLYSIADYANQEKFDFMLNIHLNDCSRRKLRKKYSGFCIFYSNNNKRSEESKKLAYSIYGEFKKHFNQSNNPEESKTVIERSNLILVGNGKLKLEVPSVLVECGYIYELKFKNPKTLEAVADCISNGTMNYLNKKSF
jgi:N-acetylmuramoyl-L-alanine amidase